MSSLVSTAIFFSLTCSTAVAISSTDGCFTGIDGTKPDTEARPRSADATVTGRPASTTSTPCCAGGHVPVFHWPETGWTGTVQVTGFASLLLGAITLAVMVTSLAILPLFGFTVLAPLIT